MKLSLFMCLFFFFVFQKALKYFPFYSPTLYTLWLQALQLFFKTAIKTLQFLENSKKMHLTAICMVSTMRSPRGIIKLSKQ